MLSQHVRAKAVSYTHLDVYKRQNLDNLIVQHDALAATDTGAQQSQSQSTLARPVISSQVDADVYKRQLFML